MKLFTLIIVLEFESTYITTSTKVADPGTLCSSLMCLPLVVGSIPTELRLDGSAAWIDLCGPVRSKDYRSSPTYQLRASFMRPRSRRFIIIVIARSTQEVEQATQTPEPTLFFSSLPPSLPLLDGEDTFWDWT